MIDNLDISTLSGALVKVAADFDEGELEHLSVTGKNELPIRDRLAWQLHRRLADWGLVVAREWARFDLAVLQDGHPFALVEGKACAAFDILLKGPGEYVAKLAGDRDKMLSHQPRPESAFLTLALTSYGGEAPQGGAAVAKYLAGHRAAASRFGSASAAQAAAVESWSEHLREMGDVVHVPMTSGRVWGLEVCVDVLVVAVGPR